MRLGTRHPRLRWTLSPLLAMATGLGAAVGAFGLSPGGSVKIEKLPSGFDATGQLRSGGRVLAVGGPLSCTKDGKVRIYVTVTQRKTGAPRLLCEQRLSSLDDER